MPHGRQLPLEAGVQELALLRVPLAGVYFPVFEAHMQVCDFDFEFGLEVGDWHH